MKTENKVVVLMVAMMVMACTMTPALAALPAGNVTQYTVDLDGAPENHFADIVADYKDELGALMEFLTENIPAKYLPMAEKIAADVDVLFPSELANEMRGIAEASDRTLGEIVLLNMLYELTAFCTSLVAQASDGSIIHARNLDYGHSELLQNVTVEVTFESGSKPVFRATTFVGFVGCLTCQNSQFQVTVDERNKGYAWENAFAAIFESAQPVTFLIREMMQDPSIAYYDAVTQLSREHLIAPSYVIVSGKGPGQGAVITRDRFEALNIWQLNPEANVTWVCETNYDHWEPAPKNDCMRRYVCWHMLEAMGASEYSPETLLGVISSAPVLNTGTVYSIVASIDLDIYVSYNRKGMLIPTPPPVVCT